MSKRDFDSVESTGNFDSERKRRKQNCIDHSYSKLESQTSSGIKPLTVVNL